MIDGTIVVLYNPSEEEIAALSDKILQTDMAVILDNSPENHFEEITSITKKAQKQVIYKSYPENIGLCKALNKGIDILAENGCKWAFILDSDSRIDADIIKNYNEFIETNKTDDVAILAPVHIFSRSRNKRYDGYKQLKRSMTSGWYLNIDIFLRMDCFFEPLFVDGLDFDYCYRVRKDQYRIIQCGNSVVFHNPGHSRQVRFLGKKMEIGQDSPLRYYMAARGEWWNFLSNKSIYDGMFFWYRVIKVIMFFGNKGEYLKQMFRGVKEGIKLYKSKKDGKNF